MKLYKFSGAGNDFVVLDGRGADVSAYRQAGRIGELCREYHTDGLMILGEGAPGEAFSMEFFNPDGSGGMMCGNGGRCIVAFADMLGLVPPSRTCLFRAPDGLHTASIISGASPLWTVKLKMIDVQGIEPMKGGYFLNTGTRHFVKFVADVNAIDMERDAKPLRWDADFAPVGTNVNFVQVAPDGLHVRTFEKGVEGETLACGTGLTASALAAYRHGIPVQAGDDANCHGRLRPAGSYRLQCRRGDWLSVAFEPGPDSHFTDVYLTGPAEMVAEIS